jgi:2-hydroxychromene-2-carboxylate isomerase
MTATSPTNRSWQNWSRQAGYDDPKALIAEAMSEASQAELMRNCTEAIMRGVIGAPTYFIDEEPFYGQDRLDYVERALAAAG